MTKRVLKHSDRLQEEEQEVPHPGLACAGTIGIIDRALEGDRCMLLIDKLNVYRSDGSRETVKPYKLRLHQVIRSD